MNNNEREANLLEIQERAKSLARSDSERFIPKIEKLGGKERFYKEPLNEGLEGNFVMVESYVEELTGILPNNLKIELIDNNVRGGKDLIIRLVE